MFGDEDNDDQSTEIELETGAEEEGSSDDNSFQSSEVVIKARKMGWVPKEEFRGDKTKWTDAAEYVRRGEQIIPIINANLRRVENENGELRGQLRQLQTQLTAASESIEALKELSTKSNIDDAKDARRELIVQKKKAEQDGEDELAVELEEKIQDATSTIRTAEKELKEKGEGKKDGKAKDDPPPDPTATPEFRAWKEENPWFGVDEDRSDYAAMIIQRMARTGEIGNFKGQAAVLEEVRRRVFEKLGDPDQDKKRTSKVDGGSRGGKSNGDGGGRNGSSGEKSYNELPAEVKAAAQRLAKKLVGPKGSGRAFTDIKTYQAHYAKTYFEANPNE